MGSEAASESAPSKVGCLRIHRLPSARHPPMPPLMWNTATAAAVSRRAGGRRRDWSQAMSAVAAAAAVLLKLLSIRDLL